MQPTVQDEKSRVREEKRGLIVHDAPLHVPERRKELNTFIIDDVVD